MRSTSGPRRQSTEAPTAPTMPLGPGAVPSTDRLCFPERYEDLGVVVARGGWGEVRRVRDRAMEREIVAKVLYQDAFENERLRARFLNEARVTASLDHPGVVPVYDDGKLPDGRPWFAMKEVTGRTLASILGEAREEAGSILLRRDVEVIARVAEIVGYAHQRGVVHRDLKPGNIMVGRAGEVFVVDWGIARVLGREEEPMTAEDAVAPRALTETIDGEVLGTMEYMAPEQARGDEVGTPADVYAAGLILHEVLHGRRVRAGVRAVVWGQAARGELPAITDGPEELRAVCARALAASPQDRFADGSALATALRAWLEGAERATRAERAVEEAERVAPEVEARRTEREELRDQARRIAGEVRDHDPVERKEPMWALEDRADALDSEIARLEARRMELLRVALQHEPALPSAHAALAKIHRARLIDAEARGDRAGAAREELRLAQHDRGEHAAFLRGMGRLELDSEPSGAQVVAYRWHVRSRRFVAELVGVLGTTPLSCELPAGSYLLELGGSDACVRYPVLIERDATWSTTRPGTERASAVDLGIVQGSGERYVPAGFAWVGGDSMAAEPIPARRVWVDSFLIQTFPVTCGEYLQFLDDLDARGNREEAARCAPRLSRAAVGTDAPLVVCEGGRHLMRPDEHGRDIALDAPIAAIDWFSARAYARWLSARTGQPWRLPNELEWEKAARGVDRRPFPWGAQPEPTWANVLGTTADPPRPAVVDSYPVDTSPYGVRGMAGNVRDWCINTWKPEGPSIVNDIAQVDAASDDDPDVRVIRGGAWTSVPAFARCAGRFAAKPDERFAVVGLRLVRGVTY